QMLRTLHERAFPYGEVVAFASERSAGRSVDFGDSQLTVQAMTDDSIQGFDIAMFSAGSSVSREWGPKFGAAGAVVVDNSSQWRMEPDIPLVIPEVNPHALDAACAPGSRRIVANPNCSTAQMLVVLKPILDAVGLERLVISTYQSVSGTGSAAIAELKSQTQALLDGHDIDPPTIYPRRIGFNVIPQVESFKDGDDYTTEERKMMGETRKILEIDDLPISATCARVPVIVGHSESVNVQTRDDLSPEAARELFTAAPGVRVVDNPANASYPLPFDAEGQDDVLVGRIRRDPSHERCLNLWIVGDNLRKGAALNAVQVAEALVARGLVGA
ncbi:MAG: aspartate-semialdehyde dehydrogenase, partial [Thermoleophilaceae bacterium]|nr:aspartate-semialdehyde dehydrogenase [Thermoleophilaceae bacterium]